MLQGLVKGKIGVIGGSIAGLSVAIGLRRLGFEVTILERALRPHGERGAGIALPRALVQKCVELDLFDSNIPCLQIFKRSLLTKDNSASDNTRRIWQQPLFLTPFNWMHIYSNLRKRIPNMYYHSGSEVVAIKQDDQQCYVSTSNSTYEFDRIIAADGVGSFVRREIFPNISPKYTDYVAWRGIIDDPEIVTNPLFNGHAPGYVFSNGHLLLYQIPAADYSTTQRMLLNWAMYEHHKDISIKELFKDKDGIQRNISLPPGKLSEANIAHLHALAQQVLPAPLANIIHKTKAPFLQAIFDFQAPKFVDRRICLLGDAATVLRPHTASGLLRALEGSISLVEAMNPISGVDIDTALLEWSNAQVKLAESQSSLSKLMGQGLVTEPPDWEKMDHNSTSCWWEKLMEGKKWYATSSDPTPETGIYHKRPQFTPNHDKEIEKLRIDLDKVHLEERDFVPIIQRSKH